MKKIACVLSLFFCLIPIMANASSLTINGSTTVLPVAQRVAEEFMKEFPNISISISGGGSGNGIKALIDGLADIANSSRFVKNKEIQLAVEKKRYPVPFAVAYDCIVPVVHPSNPIKDLSIGQLRRIYKGEIANWKELGGPNQNIVVVSRDSSSGTFEVWEEKVMNKERVSSRAQLQASNGAVAQVVSGNKLAIGYVGIGYLNKDLKPLTVNGIVGSPETTLSGSFPIARALYMFTNGWPSGDLATFINYMLHPKKGQKQVLAAGFVPLY